MNLILPLVISLYLHICFPCVDILSLWTVIFIEELSSYKMLNISGPRYHHFLLYFKGGAICFLSIRSFSIRRSHFPDCPLYFLFLDGQSGDLQEKDVRESPFLRVSLGSWGSVSLCSFPWDPQRSVLTQETTFVQHSGSLVEEDLRCPTSVSFASSGINLRSLLWSNALGRMVSCRKGICAHVFFKK